MIVVDREAVSQPGDGEGLSTPWKQEEKQFKQVEIKVGQFHSVRICSVSTLCQALKHWIEIRKIQESCLQ